VDAMSEAEGPDEGPHSGCSEIRLLPFNMTNRKRGGEIEAWDTVLIGCPGEPGSKDPMDAEEPSETLGGERFIRQPKGPPLADLHGLLAQYAVKHWELAWKHYKIHEDESAAVRLLVPPVTDLDRWTKKLQIAAAVPVPEAAAEPKSRALK